jgi:hypothetical protein
VGLKYWSLASLRKGSATGPPGRSDFALIVLGILANRGLHEVEVRSKDREASDWFSSLENCRLFLSKNLEAFFHHFIVLAQFGHL